MSVTARLFSDSSALQSSKDQTPLRLFLALTLLLPMVIVVVNLIIGVLTPLTDHADDDMTLIDGVWRLVQGQHLGIDFYDPKGFGLFQVAVLLWRLVGPHYYVMRASADLFALIIIICAAVVAARQLRQATGLAALFCVTVAFVASGPCIYGENGYGMSAYFGLTFIYDRPLMAGLLVLFVQSFANDLEVRPQRGYIDHLIAAVLLNTLFLAKISGLVVGLATIVLGSILRGPVWRNLVGIALVFFFLAGMVAIDFAVTGTSFSGLIQEYRKAAQGRVGAVSPQDMLWFACRPRILGVVLLMVLFVISRPIREGYEDNWRRCCFIIGIYWICQVVLNISNGSTTGVPLAPAAAVAIVTWTDEINPASFWNRLWRRVGVHKLDGRSARQLVPLLIPALVFMPEAYASLKAVKLDHSISSGNTRSFEVSAHRGITLNIVKNTYTSPAIPYLEQGIYAIELLGASHDKIATLDSNNPFPAMFLAPDPKGVWVWWDFTSGTNVPVGYKPSWQEVIGDACIVMEPKQSPTTPMKYYAEPLIKAVAPHLETAFTIVYEDEIWKVWKYNGGCSVTGGQAGSSLQDKNNGR